MLSSDVMTTGLAMFLLRDEVRSYDGFATVAGEFQFDKIAVFHSQDTPPAKNTVPAVTDTSAGKFAQHAVRRHADSLFPDIAPAVRNTCSPGPRRCFTGRNLRFLSEIILPGCAPARISANGHLAFPVLIGEVGGKVPSEPETT